MELILTIVFGIAGVLGFIGTFYFGYFPKRAKGRKSQPKYIPGEFFNVYKTLLSGQFNLEIKHNGIPINNSIYYISGKLVVKGDDINTKDNEISVELPKGCKWIGTNKESSHKDINAEFEKDEEIPNKAILTFNKFRQEDHIIISGIIEGNDLSADFYKKIKFTHRIDDTDDVKVVDFETSSYKWLLIFALIPLLTILCDQLTSHSLLSKKLISLIVTIPLIGVLIIMRKQSLHIINSRRIYRTLSPVKRWYIKNISLVGIWLIIALFIYELLSLIIPTLPQLP